MPAKIIQRNKKAMKKVKVDSVTIDIRSLRLFADLPVSGTATWRFEDAAVTTDVTIPGGRLTARWNDTAPSARISGSRHGSALPARVPAP